MRIIVFGCRNITVRAIQYLQWLGHEVVLAVTADSERDRIYGSPLVAEYCEGKVPHIEFEHKIDAEMIKAYKPDIIFSIYYRLILKQEVLDIPRLGCINVHPGLLPYMRGPAPSMWQVLRGEKEAGTTLHYMVEAVDAGDIIAQRKMDIEGRTGFQLNYDLMEMSWDLLRENLPAILEGKSNRIPQDHSKAVYCLPFKKSLKYIMWDDPKDIIQHIKTFTKPYDGSRTYWRKGEIIIWKASILPARTNFKPPGCYERKEDSLIIQTCTLPLLVTDWEIASGYIKHSGRFISGVPNKVGEGQNMELE